MIDRQINDYLKEYLNNEEVLKMKNYMAHGKISVYDHCLNVCRLSYKMNETLRLNCDKNTLLVGGLLHDFYLYDWHDAKLNKNIFKMHGYTHPFKACENAIKIFNVDEKVQKVIKSHMWPLTFRTFPNSKEALLVCIADKCIALKETLLRW